MSSLPSQEHGKPSVFLVIIIPSEPSSRNLRDETRSRFLNTTVWAGHLGGIEGQYLKFKVMFLVGLGSYDPAVREDLEQEMLEHGDIYGVPGLVESTENVRFKILHGLLKSVELFDYKYLVKVDHDTITDVPNLVKGLVIETTTPLYAGTCHRGLRNGPYAHQFKYCLGGGYVLSHDLVAMISALPDWSFKEYVTWSEDGYVGYLVHRAKQENGLMDRKDIPKSSNHSLRVRTFFRAFFKTELSFDKYFYHYLKLQSARLMVFECRIRHTSLDTCPSRTFTWTESVSDSCLCVKGKV